VQIANHTAENPKHSKDDNLNMMNERLVQGLHCNQPLHDATCFGNTMRVSLKKSLSSKRFVFPSAICGSATISKVTTLILTIVTSIASDPDRPNAHFAIVAVVFVVRRRHRARDARRVGYFLALGGYFGG